MKLVLAFLLTVPAFAQSLTRVILGGCNRFTRDMIFPYRIKTGGFQMNGSKHALLNSDIQWQAA